MSFPAMTPFEVISLGDISISLVRGHYQFASTRLDVGLLDVGHVKARDAPLLGGGQADRHEMTWRPQGRVSCQVSSAA